jgi:hypothetical protein
MDRIEALQFIGLKEPVDSEAALTKCDERISYHLMLMNNAPNKAVKAMQQVNVDRLYQIKEILSGAERRSYFREPVMERPVKTEIPEPPVFKEVPMDEPKKKLTGWLIIHAENRRPEAFEIFEGLNFIGRKKKNDTDHCILLHDDPYISRTHAFIKCRIVNGIKLFDLYDGDGDKASANGVFVNANDQRIHVCCSLRQNDTIQIGSTKLIFRVDEGRTVEEEVDEVRRMPFLPTVKIKI